ncbi:MAG: SsrA-binding protein SmpB, partial [Thermomicrobiales bacterium]|nr:SsrA-binding protein SmpB [Thermomicrobiales bacterium]
RGTEIKSLREGKVQMNEAYARIDNGELWLVGMHISPYTHGSHSNHDPDRPRKLMAHHAQIANMRAEVEQRGLTLVPLKLYLKGGKAKVELGLCRGKKLYDKRQSDSEREAKRDVQRALRDRG